jgi:hypothetical protein
MNIALVLGYDELPVTVNASSAMTENLIFTFEVSVTSTKVSILVFDSVPPET